MIEVVRAENVADMDQVRALFQEYAAMLGVELCFQGFTQELATLPGKYAPPHGCLLLAKEGNTAVGCVALRTMEEPGACEMKRLYVQPPYRGTGLGRRLTKLIMEEAYHLGYAIMRLDTLDTLKAAIQLYRELGFVEITPYYHNPLPNVVYMEWRVQSPATPQPQESRT